MRTILLAGAMATTLNGRLARQSSGENRGRRSRAASIIVRPLSAARSAGGGRADQVADKGPRHQSRRDP
jgi:hypothetical protein